MVKEKSGNTFNFKKEVNINGDFVAGDKPVTYSQTIINQTPVEFIRELRAFLGQIGELKNTTELNQDQKSELVLVEEKITDALQTANQPNPDGEKIHGNLEEAKKKMETLAGSLSAAIGLGTVLAKLIEMAIKVFGG